MSRKKGGMQGEQGREDRAGKRGGKGGGLGRGDREGVGRVGGRKEGVRGR